MCAGAGGLLRVFASPQRGTATALDTASRLFAYRFPFIESESSSTAGRIPQKRSPRPTDRCANSWRNPTTWAAEGVYGGEASQGFEMDTSCEGQCIIMRSCGVMSRHRIDSKEAGPLDLETTFRDSLHICVVQVLRTRRKRYAFKFAIHIKRLYFSLTPSFLISKPHKHTRIQ